MGKQARKKKRKRLKRRDLRMRGIEHRPTKEPLEVYVTVKGAKYHSRWCDAMNGAWLFGSTAIRVVSRMEAFAMEYESCGLCREMEGSE